MPERRKREQAQANNQEDNREENSGMTHRNMGGTAETIW